MDIKDRNDYLKMRLLEDYEKCTDEEEFVKNYITILFGDLYGYCIWNFTKQGE